MRADIGLPKAYRLLNHGPTVIVGAPRMAAGAT
jgi:hypothetical protein